MRNGNRMCVTILLLALLFALTGCAGSGTSVRQSGTNKVEETINAQMEAADGKEAADTDADLAAEVEQAQENRYEKVDYDLTQMNSDMVYAMVFDMLDEPERYLGSTVKIKGTLAVFSDEESGQNYYTCVIEDATACCAQGMEFIWGDGSHAPSEYPVEGAKLEVAGVFETYEENDVMYYRLNDADMNVVQFNIT